MISCFGQEIYTNCYFDNQQYEIGDTLRATVVVSGVKLKLQDNILIIVNNDTLVFDKEKQEAYYSKVLSKSTVSLTKWSSTISYPVNKKKRKIKTFQGSVSIRDALNKFPITFYKGVQNTLYLPINHCADIKKPHLEGALLNKVSREKIDLTPSDTQVKIITYDCEGVEYVQVIPVVEVPNPKITIYSDGSRVDLKRGIPFPSVLNVMYKSSSTCEMNFSSALYITDKVKVTLIRNRRPVYSKTFTKTNNLMLNEFAVKAKPGDHLLIEIKEVKHRTRRGLKSVRLRFTDSLLMIPIIE